MQYEDEHDSESESLVFKGFDLIYPLQLHIHLV